MRYLVLCIFVFSFSFADAKQTLKPQKKEFHFKLGIDKNSVKEFVVKIPNNFTGFYDTSDEEMFKQEFIPTGETFDSWNEIITVFEKGVYAQDDDATKIFIDHIKSSYSDKDSKIEFDIKKEKNVPVVIYMVDTPSVLVSRESMTELKTERISGKSEIVGSKVVQGSFSLAIVQYSIRYDNNISPDAKTAIRKKVSNFLDSCPIEQVSRSELPQDEMFPPRDGKMPPLKGRIEDGRYHAPQNVFSCQAYDFGEGSYRIQDALVEQMTGVGFYSSLGDFKKVEIFFFPRLEKNPPSEKELKSAFEGFGIGILKSVDNAQGIQILKEEMLGDSMFFAAISIEKMSVLKPDGHYIPSTRGYLIFRDKDKLAVLTHQLVTPLGERHDPQKHVERLKREILEFQKTLELGAIPEWVLEKIKQEAA